MRDHIFRSVELLIYVFDIESGDQGSDFSQFADVIEAVEQHSPLAAVLGGASLDVPANLGLPSGWLAGATGAAPVQVPDTYNRLHSLVGLLG